MSATISTPTVHPPPPQFESTGFIEAQVDSAHYDSDGDDGGYATGSEVASSYQSEVFDYRYENGRRYHGYREGRYLMPNDETEQNRLDMVHELCLLLLDGELHTVPFEEPPMRILDVGTGTGIWAIDAAMKYEGAEVIGTDLSPIQPEWVPPNCRFDIDDAESEWVYSKNSFDFIHSRHLATSICDWPLYIERIFEHLKPGGWVEFAEHSFVLFSDDNTYPPDCALATFWTWFREALGKKGGDPNVYAQLVDLLNAHGGFTNIRVVTNKVPWGLWPKDKKMKDAGKWGRASIETGLEAYGNALFLRELGKKPEDTAKLFADAKKELDSKKHHCYQLQSFIIARKPLHSN